MVDLGLFIITLVGFAGLEWHEDRFPGSLISTFPEHHTMDHDPFTKSPLASMQLTLRRHFGHVTLKTTLAFCPAGSRGSKGSLSS